MLEILLIIILAPLALLIIGISAGALFGLVMSPALLVLKVGEAIYTPFVGWCALMGSITILLSLMLAEQLMRAL